MNPQIIIFALVAIVMIIVYTSIQSKKRHPNLRWLSITKEMIAGKNDKENENNVRWLDGLVKYGFNYQNDKVYGRVICRNKREKETDNLGIPGRLIKEDGKYMCAIVDANKVLYKRDFDILLDLPDNVEIPPFPRST